jgi:molybdenum-dependent DNA-binding transcriptional regulator ModE
MSFNALTLECFLAVADTGSLTRAAEVVGRTQSAVSQQMAKLEQDLGKTLFLRGKKFVLTPDGEILLGYARQIVKLQREAFDRFREPELEGEVRFGLPEDGLPRLHAWMEGAAWRWGLDASHRASLGLGASGDTTSGLWALRRMLLGYASGDQAFNTSAGSKRDRTSAG